jgi:pimeloyl-ACP methyl ester carboxylesterase
MRRVIAAAFLACAASLAAAQDYEREARWAEQTLATLNFGEPVRIAQRNGHRFLALYLVPEKQPARGAVIVAHGRGWGPDFELYGALRTQLADAGYATLSIQLPVLPGTAKIGDYLPTFPDADERFALAAEWLRAQGNRNIAIVSHSLGATMANHYLIRHPESPVGAWVFIGIINGLEDMFRVRVPVLDVFGEKDWDVTKVGADERRAQIARIAGSRQIMVRGAQHFFDGQQEELVQIIAGFLAGVFAGQGR